MKKILLFFVIILLSLQSCQKEPTIRKVKYQINGLSDPYKIVYFDQNGNTIKQNITPSSNKVWKLEYTAPEGKVMYLYLEFKENISNNMAFTAGIYVDGKAYSQTKNFDVSVGDTIFKIKRSGIVPFTN
ncbi:MAG: hypothetical protein AUJ98_02275 [Bacteroidetes bacterium CG2_30_33_31]|nr:MAG: hypothetical protein AUJ98_02275 [Bacteroidetes bacterium CG2_30_33_31]